MSNTPVDNPSLRTFMVAGLEQKCYHKKEICVGLLATLEIRMLF